jgi:hypothetical protein
MSEALGAEPRFTLRVEGDREVLLRRQAEALVAVMPGMANIKRLRVIGAAMVPLGIVYAVAAEMPILGIALVAIGAAWALILNQGYMVRRIVPTLRRSRILGVPSNLVIEPTGLHLATGTFTSWTAWSICDQVIEHDGGLAVISSGGSAALDIPPSAFATPGAPPKELVGQWATAWIARAHTAQAAPPPPVPSAG